MHTSPLYIFINSYFDSHFRFKKTFLATSKLAFWSNVDKLVFWHGLCLISCVARWWWVWWWCKNSPCFVWNKPGFKLALDSYFLWLPQIRNGKKHYSVDTLISVNSVWHRMKGVWIFSQNAKLQTVHPNLIIGIGNIVFWLSSGKNWSSLRGKKIPWISDGPVVQKLNGANPWKGCCLTGAW